MHVNKVRLSIFLTATIGFSPFFSAQELDSVLKNLINKGLEKNHSINIHNLNSEQSKVDQKLAKAIFLPKISFNSSFTRLDNDITFPAADWFFISFILLL